MDSILDILRCKWCLSQLTDPVNLPCGESICEKHTKELRETEWKCQLCDEVHALATGEKYPVTKPLAAMLKTNITKLDFGPIHKKAKEEVEAVEAKQRELMHAIREPNDYVENFAIKYRNQVSLAREEMINIIDQACDSMNAEIVQYVAESKERLRADAINMNELATTLEPRMTVWKKSLDELVVNEPLWAKIAQEAKSMQEQIDGRIKEALVIPPVLKQIPMLIETNTWTKLSDRLHIVPMRDEKCLIVGDLSKIDKDQSCKSLRSRVFDVGGFTFELRISSVKLKDENMHLAVILHSKSDHHNQTIKLTCTTFIFGKNLQIIKQSDSKELGFTQVESRHCSCVMSLNDIMAHPAYDAKDDMVKFGVIIDHESFQVQNV